MRDDPCDAPIPEEFKPSDWHVKELEKARSRMRELEGFSMSQAAAMARSDYESEVKRREESDRKRATLRRQYEAMLTEVRRWSPPTPDHRELREFMEKQIVQSIDFDCGRIYDGPPPLFTGPEWLADQRKKVEWNIAYHTKEHAAEVARCKSRTEWLRALRESLQ